MSLKYSCRCRVVAAPRAENLSRCRLSRKPKYVVALSLSRNKNIVACPALQYFASNGILYIKVDLSWRLEPLARAKMAAPWHTPHLTFSSLNPHVSPIYKLTVNPSPLTTQPTRPSPFTPSTLTPHPSYITKTNNAICLHNQLSTAISPPIV